MQTKLGDDAFDGTGTNGLAGLAQLLADHGGGGVGIQEAITDDLLDDLVGAAIVGFGAALLVLQGQGAAGSEGLTQLEVALLGIAELGGGGDWTGALAFPLIEHGEFGKNRVVPRDGQLAPGADQNQRLFSDIEHTRTSIGEEGDWSQIKYVG